MQRGSILKAKRSPRGPLIGEPTFGKGSLQSIRELSDKSSVHVTIAHWLTPDRHEIQGAGLTPDMAITPSAEALDSGEDPQLEAALHYLAARTVQGSAVPLCKVPVMDGSACEL